MENKSIFILLLLSMMLLCLTTVNAEEIADNNNLFSETETPVCEMSDEEQESDTNTQTGSFNDLQTDINNAGDVLNITKDYTYQNGDNEIKITKKIIINGNNHIIDAQNHCRILTISAPHVTISNLTFKNGYTNGDGGAIYTFKNDITINNSKFINNYAKNGGAIYASNNAIRFNLINTELINNAALYGKGGALYCSGYDSQIMNSTFDSNIAQNGGSVYWGESKKGWNNKYVMYGNEGRIINSTFIENTAVNGGAVFWFADTGEIINSTFKRNIGYNADNGGAIYWKGENGIVNNTMFIQNTAESRAGAIYWEGSHGTVTQSTFTNNTAKCMGSQFRGGGAIMWKGKYGQITNSNFTGNTAQTDGGAIHWYETNNAKGEIRNCNFNNNIAQKGSAIFVHYGDVDIKDSSFFNNQAESDEIACEIRDDEIISQLTGYDNMINAIHNYAIFGYNQVSLSNIQYWGLTQDITEYPSNIQVNIELYNAKGKLVRNVSLTTDANGIAKTGIEGLNPGNYTVKAIHYTDSYYTGISKTNTLEVERISTEIIAQHIWDKALTHDDITVRVVDENGAMVKNGTCVLAFENRTYESEVKNGVAVFRNVEMPFPGNYDESVKYLGNDYYKSSTGDVEVTVLKLDTHTYDHNITYISQHEILVEVTVVDEFNNPVLSGEVELDVFYEDEEPVLKNVLKASVERYYAQIHDGKAIFDIVLAHNGHYLLDAEYHGDRLYNPSGDVADVLTSALNTTVKAHDITAKSGESREVTCEVLDDAGNPVKNGTVILKINDNEYEASVSDGKATFKDVVMPSDDTVAVITYIGNEDYSSSNTTFNINIEKNETDNTTENTTGDNSTNATVGFNFHPGGVISGQASFEAAEMIEDDVDDSIESDDHVTGNPLFMMLVVLLSLLCTICFKRGK